MTTPRIQPRRAHGGAARARALDVTLTALVLAAAPAVSAAQDARIARGFRSCLVPMDHSSGHIQVEVWIGGEGPFLFQVDTYASMDACIDQAFADRMSFPRIGRAPNSDGVTTRMKDYVRIDSLRLGEANFDGARALVDDYGWVAEDGRPIQGLLGFSLFRELLWTIDYPRSRLVLRRGFFPKDASNCVTYSTPTGSPDIELSLGGEPVVFGIDTGFGGTMLLSVQEHGELALTGERLEVGSGRSAYSTFKIYAGTLAGGVGLAGHSIEPPRVLFRDDEAKALIGRDLLLGYEVTFDPSTKRVRFALPESPAERDPETNGATGPPKENGGTVKDGRNQGPTWKETASVRPVPWGSFGSRNQYWA